MCIVETSLPLEKHSIFNQTGASGTFAVPIELPRGPHRRPRVEITPEAQEAARSTWCRCSTAGVSLEHQQRHRGYEWSVRRKGRRPEPVAALRVLGQLPVDLDCRQVLPPFVASEPDIANLNQPACDRCQSRPSHSQGRKRWLWVCAGYGKAKIGSVSTGH